jgi:hypothetical protein
VQAVQAVEAVRVVEAGQVHDHRQLGPHPTGERQPAALKLPTSHLGQSVRGPLPAAAGVGGIGRARQRLQGALDDLAGFGGQDAADDHHPINGGGEPHPAPFVPSLGGSISAVRVDGVLEMLDRLA